MVKQVDPVLTFLQLLLVKTQAMGVCNPREALRRGIVTRSLTPLVPSAGEGHLAAALNLALGVSLSAHLSLCLLFRVVACPPFLYVLSLCLLRLPWPTSLLTHTSTHVEK